MVFGIVARTFWNADCVLVGCACRCLFDCIEQISAPIFIFNEKRVAVRTVSGARRVYGMVFWIYYYLFSILTMRGFSLMELMIVIALFTIITGAALMNHARFGEGILATNLAYDVALSFREAQSYGISVREGAGANVFDTGYGIHFGSWSGVESGEPDRQTQFVFFADRNNDKRYNGSDITGTCVTVGPSECLKVFRFERGSKIESFCGMVSASGASECKYFGLSNNTLSFLGAVFTRPNPDAFIRTNVNNEATERYRSARITIVSPRGKERRTIEVFQTGQISIRNQ